MRTPLRFITCAIAAGTAALFSASLSAQSYPAKPVRIITPFPSGSGPDAVLRVIGDKLNKAWGQQLVIENRAGAQGFIAIEAAKKAAPDGYTLVQMDDAHMALQPHLYKKIPYELGKDFDPVATLFQTYFFVVVPVNSPWKNVADLVAAAKAKPGELKYGSWFVGSPGHVGAAMLEAASGTQMVHIPFKEMSQLFAAVASNDVAWSFGSAASAGPLYRSAKVKFIAVAAPKRVAGYTDVPTMAEAGGPTGLEVKAWVALFAPKGTPAPVVQKINEALAKILAEPDVKERFQTFGFEPLATAPGEIMKLVESDSRRYADIVKRAKISIE